MSDQFTTDLQSRLSAFAGNVSFDTLSAAFKKANFEGYRHLKGSFFGLTEGTFDTIFIGRAGIISLNIGAHDFMPVSFVENSLALAADHQDLALAA